MSATGTNNGVNVEALLGARQVIEDTPEAGQFAWRASCEWKNGTHSHSTVEGYFGWGDEQKHRSVFNFDADHPETFAAEDNGATPVEYVLVGLASCLTAGVRRGRPASRDPVALGHRDARGAMDIKGILGVDNDVRNGFSGIKVTYDIDADASKEDIEALVAQSQKRSAVYDIVTNPTNVTVEVT